MIYSITLELILLYRYVPLMFEFADCWGNQGHKDHILSREVSTRERPIITHSQHGGVPCNYSAVEEKKSCSDAYDGVEVLILW